MGMRKILTALMLGWASRGDPKIPTRGAGTGGPMFMHHPSDRRGKRHPEGQEDPHTKTRRRMAQASKRRNRRE